MLITVIISIWWCYIKMTTENPLFKITFAKSFLLINIFIIFHLLEICINFPVSSLNFSDNFDQAKETVVTSLYRLPGSVIPVEYRVKLIPNLAGNFNFSGEIYINIFVRKITRMLVLHSKNLQISDVQIYNVSDDGGKQNVSSYYTLPGNDESLIIWTKNYLNADAVFKLCIKFQGIMRTRMVGFYRSTYQVGNQIKFVYTGQKFCNKFL